MGVAASRKRLVLQHGLPLTDFLGAFSPSPRQDSGFETPCAAWAYMRMFVSTKYLSLMEFVARSGRCPPEVEAFPEVGKGPSASLVERLPLAHDRLDPIGQKAAD